MLCLRWRALNRYQQSFFVAINLYSRHFLHENLADVIQSTLDKHTFREANLKLEITERNLMSYAPDVQRVLHAIRALRVQFAIDNFGVGFSSLSDIYPPSGLNQSLLIPDLRWRKEYEKCSGPMCHRCDG